MPKVHSIAHQRFFNLQLELNSSKNSSAKVHEEINWEEKCREKSGEIKLRRTETVYL